MRKRASAVSVIGGADGPTSVFIAKRNPKLTWRQKLQQFIYKRKRAYVEKTLKAGGHTIEEVMSYIVDAHGFHELDRNSDKVREEYHQMRASCIMQYAPELLGEYAKLPTLKSESMEDIKAHIEQSQKQQQKALEVPVAEFDIDFYKFEKTFVNRNDNMHIVFEKRFAYISGGASGNRRIIKKFQRMYKDIYRYYGVTQEDIRKKSKRYEDVVRTLCQ